MGDFALRWDGTGADLAIEDDDLAEDNGLQTSLFLSLFTDRRATDDQLPAELDDRRGWWGDQFAEVEGDQHGSHLWLLERARVTPELLHRGEGYDREALAWMLEDGVCEQLDVALELAAGDRLYHAIAPHRPGQDPAKFRYPHVWDGEAAALES